MSTNSEAVSPGHSLRPPMPGAVKVRLFYGWLMLPQAMLTQILTAPGQTVGVAVFSAVLTRSLEISETQLTGAYGLGTLLASLPLPLVGGLIDRYGIRRSLALVVLLFGGSCLFMSRVSGLAELFLAFFLLRFLGQGAMSLLAGNTPSMWFHRRLGTVTGLLNVGVVLTMGQLPLLIRLLVDRVGWRSAYVVMGLLVWAVMFPLLAFFFRNRPEDVGQATDGDLPTPPPPTPRPPETTATATARQPEREQPESDWIPAATLPSDFGLRAALATRSYWIMLIIYLAWAMIGTALVFNASQLFASRGLDVSAADFALMAFFTSMAAAQLIGGFLADRFPPRHLIALGVAGMTLALGLLAAGSSGMALAAYVLFGAGQGTLGSSSNTLWVRYFGRAHLGKIRSLVLTVAVAGSSVGPFLMGWCFDALGNYDLSLWSFLIIMGLLVPAGLLATPPGRWQSGDGSTQWGSSRNSTLRNSTG